MKRNLKIGIIAAMEKEISTIKAAIENMETVKCGGIDFYIGKIGEKEIVAAQCGIGKVFAAMCAQAMILKFSPDCIINTGVAGSLTRELKILDCMIADSVVQHDMDTSAIGDEVGMISGINVVEIYTSRNVSELLMAAAEKCSVHIAYGKIATGDKFIAEDADRDRIRNVFRADCCEMEGGAIGQVCYVNKVPFGIVRTISDSFGEDSGMDYMTFAGIAAENSAKLTLEFINLA